MLSAGTDPTYIPGLDIVAAAGPETAGPEPAERPDEAADGEEQQAAEDADATEDGEEPGDDPPEGPSFEVTDRRGAIVADGNGVTFRLDDTEARWAWTEIGSVEIGASRFGRRFEVAVGTTDHRRFEAEVEASSKKQLEEWTADLDAVLDAWFDGGK